MFCIHQNIREEEKLPFLAASFTILSKLDVYNTINEEELFMLVFSLNKTVVKTKRQHRRVYTVIVNSDLLRSDHLVINLYQCLKVTSNIFQVIISHEKCHTKTYHNVRRNIHRVKLITNSRSRNFLYYCYGRN